MTEADWVNRADPQSMLALLREHGKLNDRRAMLFATACCRCRWPQLPYESRNAVDVVERFADGNATWKELWNELEATRSLGWTRNAAVVAAEAAYHMAGANASDAARAAAEQADEATTKQAAFTKAYFDAEAATKNLQAAFLRDVFGNPWRAEPALDPAWLTDAVVKLAHAVYQDRLMPSGHLDRTRLAMLADGLQEAGCQEAALLGHLRDPHAVHIRGCHVLDLLLQRE